MVLYGVDECPSGTSRSARLAADLECLFATIDSTFQAQALKDCFRLRKYNRAHDKPRPILVKFVRIADVSNILSKKRNLHQPYFIKPECLKSKEAGTVLMRERWNLIQSGIPRNEVKLRNARLYVKNKLHGSVVDSSFVRSTDQSVSDAAVSDSAVHLLSATQTQSTFVTHSPLSATVTDTPESVHVEAQNSTDTDLSPKAPVYVPLSTACTCHSVNNVPPTIDQPL